MDLLKSIMNKKAADAGSQKQVKIADIEKKKADAYYQEQEEKER